MTLARKLAAILGCLIIPADRAISDGATAAAILKLPISVRQAGMGDLSVGADDVLRTWSNPALLASMRARGAVAIGGASLFDGEDTVLGSAVGWQVKEGIHIGGLASYYGTDFPEIDEYGDLTGMNLKRGAIVGGLSGAVRPIECLLLGLTGKVISDELLDESESAFALDAGAAYFRNGLSAGFAVRNVGQNIYSGAAGNGAESELPLEWRVAGAYCYRPRRVTFGIEYVDLKSGDERIGIGMEWWPADIFALRTGLADVQHAQRRISFGLTVLYRALGFDYAYISHPLGDTHRASLGYSFGKGVVQGGLDEDAFGMNSTH